MNKLTSVAVNFFLKSKKGNDVFAEIRGLSRFGHFGEAASVARKVLDENDPVTIKKMPEITSYERKLLSGAFLSNKDKAEQAGQEIPGYSRTH